MDSLNSFQGNVVFPEKLTPTLQKFKDLAGKRLANIMEKAPFDLFVKEMRRGGKHVEVGAAYKPTGENVKMNFFLQYLVYDVLHSTNQKILLEDVAKEFDILSAQVNSVEKVMPDLKPFPESKTIIPKIIGSNAQIKARQNLYRQIIKRKH